MSGIVEIQLGYLRKLLAARRMDLELDDKSKLWLAERGYDPVYGARPLKRTIQTNLQNHLAEMILRGEIPDGSSIHVTTTDGGLSFKINKGDKKGNKSAA
jgi:ATP-dependent Clp protease ATP-binding subunit ClpB